ncbi:hypothetical protein GUITHDRAFT_110835 [Guillardia theta CCMP2712]|uniref:Uncharacterized protein n=1 Tax=Guillardia theta (strain CCMP2712) TaxID=905079 RepID=L1J3K2_GUITC|nr:hypothetical protein GUITHDRAFT_110835 [Guillardia theta CCMP2712]EKX43108.1 hypothetical protein GUITHDRAFT_110835 [Guillardia theta CCMP2712]|eukprot:XP_005830088.1 hypothetical protein GUITHDRAFT_110835 [Guillardia theta CCMP2712]
MGAAACKCEERDGSREAEDGGRQRDKTVIGKHPHAQLRLPDGLKKVNIPNRRAFVPTHIAPREFHTVGVDTSEASHRDIKHSSPVKLKSSNLLQETSPRERLNAMIREMQVHMECQQSRIVDGDQNQMRKSGDSLQVRNVQPIDEFLYPRVAEQNNAHNKEMIDRVL